MTPYNDSNIRFPIYLDYSATTPVDPRVAEKMCSYLTPDGQFGNPASRSHPYGWAAEEAIDQARSDVADLVNANPKEIIFTSGATESDNLAIKGAAHFYKKKGNHIVTVKTEHKAVLDTCRQLEREGFELTVSRPRVVFGKDENGRFVGYHAPTGILPNFLNQCHAYGFSEMDESCPFLRKHWCLQ